jgi:segregation and condensation protein A
VGTFEGPLDLLLHLIRANEISITDIPIVEVCRQYDAYLLLMTEMNLEVAGDYLVMAATLAHIKSRILLPAPPAAAGEEPEDPRADLVRQLLEYQRMKLAAESLREIDDLAAAAFGRGNAGEDPLGPWRDEAQLEVSLFDLLAAFRRVVEALADAQPLHVPGEEISVADTIAWIVSRLESQSPRLFQDLIAEMSTRHERIVAFLAILEMIRLRRIRAVQRRHQGEILIALQGPEAPPAVAGEGSDA